MAAAALKCQADKNVLASTSSVTRSEQAFFQQGRYLCIPENGITMKKKIFLAGAKWIFTGSDTIRTVSFNAHWGDQIKAEDILLTEHFKSLIHSGFIS